MRKGCRGALGGEYGIWVGGGIGRRKGGPP